MSNFTELLTFRQIPLERFRPYKAAGLLGVTPGYEEDSLSEGPQQWHVAPKKEETFVSSQRVRKQSRWEASPSVGV